MNKENVLDFYAESLALKFTHGLWIIEWSDKTNSIMIKDFAYIFLTPNKLCLRFSRYQVWAFIRVRRWKTSMSSTGSFIFFFLLLPSSNVNKQKDSTPPPPDFCCFKKSWRPHDVFHFLWHFASLVALWFPQGNNHRRTSLQIEPWIFESLLQIPKIRITRSTHNQDGISGYSTRFCTSHPTGHILLIISPGNQIKANNNGAAKWKFSNVWNKLSARFWCEGTGCRREAERDLAMLTLWNKWTMDKNSNFSKKENGRNGSTCWIRSFLFAGILWSL